MQTPCTPITEKITKKIPKSCKRKIFINFATANEQEYFKNLQEKMKIIFSKILIFSVLFSSAQQFDKTNVLTNS